MPTPFAYLMILGWPIVVLLIFWRMRAATALIVSIFAGYLFLPRRPVFDFPLVPTIDKDVVLTLAAFLMCLVFQSRESDAREALRRPGWLPEQPFARLLLAGLCVLPAFTVLTNMDPAQIGVVVRPGLRVMEIPSALFLKLIPLIIFIISYRFIYKSDDHEKIIFTFIFFGIIYSFPIIIEIFLSPQLNRWIYGFYQFEFAQQRRGDGYRPVVFLEHGLWTALFVSMSFASAVFAVRYGSRRTLLLFVICAIWLFAILVFSRSLGALALGLIFSTVGILFKKRMVVIFSAAISVVILLYPMGRSVGLIPTSNIVSLAERIDSGRAASLQYRFDNEELYLARANERPIFGWGGWGRGRIYDEETGRSIGASDAYWVILFSTYGWFGYLIEYLILTYPVFVILLRRNEELHWAHVAMTAILVLNLSDMLFNATLTPLTWLLAGALTAAVSGRSAMTSATAVVSNPGRRSVRAVIGSAPRG